jgi:hypothetical protein
MAPPSKQRSGPARFFASLRMTTLLFASLRMTTLLFASLRMTALPVTLRFADHYLDFRRREIKTTKTPQASKARLPGSGIKTTRKP